MAELQADVAMADPEESKTETKTMVIKKWKQVRRGTEKRAQSFMKIGVRMLKWKENATSVITKVKNWGYLEENGPEVWHKAFPVARGVRQSPIDICTPGAVPGSLPPVCAKYEASAGLSLTNTGATWMVKFPAEGSSLTGGALHGEYKVWQMHGHWGACSGHGSEHTLDGRQYDAEIHIVHWNTKYGTLDNAIDKPDGLAVLGVFVEEGEEEHPEFAKIMSALEASRRKGQKEPIKEALDPAMFLPENKTIYTYEGSLTTPPLLESVIWTVYRDPVTFSREQVRMMRCLKTTPEHEDENDMVNNYRKPCALGSRKIQVSA